jgi:hypothetical protein
MEPGAGQPGVDEAAGDLRATSKSPPILFPAFYFLSFFSPQCGAFLFVAGTGFIPETSVFFLYG